MQHYLADNWRLIFEHNGLRTFDDFWRREIEWFEEPNYRRGGWSGVGRHELKSPEGGTVAVFVKRQENHVTRTWRHPLRGMATLQREFDNLLGFQSNQLPAPAPLYFAVWQVDGNLRAVLITEELTGFRSLESWTEEWIRDGWPPVAARRRVIEAVAKVVRRMHAHRFQHNCLYAKHIFVKPAASGEVEVCVIDLEKARRRWLRRLAVHRDLDTLHRHTPGWRRADRMRFLVAYLQVKSARMARPLWRVLERLSEKKMD